MTEQQNVCAVVHYRIKPGTEQEFLLYERYRDGAALDAHRASVHFEALAKKRALPAA